jgi:diphosphomevalonate decarboxylase
VQAVAQAGANIALVKYWGKRDDGPLNLPAVGSLSITLDALWTRTDVSFDALDGADEFVLNGHRNNKQARRVSATLDHLRLLARAAGITAGRACVRSENNFPTGAGLASSASGFAALVVAANAALGMDLPPERLSALARQGSGSAARSIFGGFVEMARGDADDGSDAVAMPLMESTDWPLEVVVAITATGEKATGSTDGMNLTARTSPYWQAWLSSQEADLAEARAAVLARDFERLALISEFSCLKMHGLALSASPGLAYWNGATMECLHLVRALRKQGLAVFFTIDAGPQLKAVCSPAHAGQVRAALADVPGVMQTLHTRLGSGARVIDRQNAA